MYGNIVIALQYNVMLLLYNRLWVYSLCGLHMHNTIKFSVLVFQTTDEWLTTLTMAVRVSLRNMILKSPISKHAGKLLLLRPLFCISCKLHIVKGVQIYPVSVKMDGFS